MSECARVYVTHALEFPTDHRLPIFLSLPEARLESDEEAVMPRRVVAHVVLEHLLGVAQLARPEGVLVEVGEQPLAIGPGVVVLRVDLERSRDEVELGPGLAGLGEDEASVVPDLVRLEVQDGELVHQPELDVERGFESHQRLVSVLPARLARQLVACESEKTRVVPGGIVGWVHANDVLGEVEHPGTHLTGHDDRTKVIGRILV